MKKAVSLTAWVLIGALAGAASAGQAPAPAAASWASLQFLVGTWEGLGSGAPGEGRGGCAFVFELEKNILVRRNWAEFAPKPGEAKGSTHQDLMIFYVDPGDPRIKAIYFDMESHVIHYVLLPPSRPDAVVFETEPGTQGPRFRLSYEKEADGRLLNIFAMAMPGQEFKEYTRGRLVRK